MKKILLLISIILFLGGCYDYKELNDYAIATGMSIDYEDDKYEVSLLISNSPKSGADSSNNYQTVVYSGKGDTIYDAIKEIGLISPKELYIGHLSIIVLSESTAKKGLASSLDFLLEDPKSKKNFYIALAKKDKAKDILSVTTPLTDFPSQTLADNLKSTDYLQGSVVAIDFNTLMYKLVNPGISPVLNSFKVVGSEKKGAKASNIETNLPKAYIKLDNIGIFKEDKFIKWASKDESRGINIINDKVEELYVQVDCGDGYIVVDTENLKTSRKIDKNGNVTLSASAVGVVKEVSCNIDLKKKKNIEKLEKKVEAKIKKFMKKGIKVAKENKTDIYGFGLKYYQEYPEKFNKIDDWNEYFSNINVKYKVNIDLNHTGSIEQGLERVTNEKNN